MFDHVKFAVSDYAASKAVFLKALEPIGVTVASEWPPNGVELSAKGDGNPLEQPCAATSNARSRTSRRRPRP